MIREEWAKYPPLRVLAAGYLGWKAPAKQSSIADLLSEFPGGEIK